MRGTINIQPFHWKSRGHVHKNITGEINFERKSYFDSLRIHWPNKSGWHSVANFHHVVVEDITSYYIIFRGMYHDRTYTIYFHPVSNEE